MIYKAEELIEKLYQYSNDYAEGKTQDFTKVFKDCKLAADMIGVLRSSKHTQKRRAHRLSKKNREQRKKIESLMAEIEHIKQEF